MPGQWEFQIGHRGFEGEKGSPLIVADHLWLARWLLHRIAENCNIVASFDPKPVKGDWNGAGARIQIFQLKKCVKKNGRDVMDRIINKLKENHEDHIGAYGADLSSRLTGLHETCSINEFRSGVADRGASIRIPRQVEENRLWIFRR